MNRTENKKPDSRARRAVNFTAIALASALAAYALILLCAFIAALVQTAEVAEGWQKWQTEHIAELEEAYESGTAPKIDEQSLSDFDLAAADEIRLDDIRVVATHNSYKQDIPSASAFLYGAIGMGGRYGYSLPTLTEQLNTGVRSFELDIYSSSSVQGGFAVMHNSLVDGGSSASSLYLALSELKMWSDYNPKHVPVTVLIEPKTLGGMGYSALNSDDLLALDEMLAELFGAKLYTPAQALGGYSSFSELRADNGYPFLSEMLGKFIFLLHDGSAAERYIALDTTMRTQKMFYAIDLYNDSGHAPQAMFAIINGFSDERGRTAYERAVATHFIIRTMADEYGDFGEEKLASVLQSEANIISTDYPPGSAEEYGYEVTFGGGKTISRVS